MNPRYYKKKGASYKERLRCPLCGKLSTIGYFSQKHQFGIYKYRYGGRGDISVKFVHKSSEFLQALTESIVNRFLDLLQQFTGQRYYSQSEVDILTGNTIQPRAITKIKIKPRVKPRIKPRIIPRKISNVKVVIK